MKKLIKFIPAALAAFAMASCSSDDFGTANTVDLSGKTVLEVTDGDAAITRSFKTATLGTQYEAGDVMRVYDGLLQKFYNFDFATDDATSKFVYNGAEDLTDFDAQFVLYGVEPNNLSYAGWKNGKNIALLKVEDEVDYEESGATTTGYKSILPMIGKVNSIDKSGAKPWLKTTTYTLTARAKVTFKNGAGANVKRVRARALKFADGKSVADIALAKNAATAGWNGSTHAATDAFDGIAANAGAPTLNGWFEAVLVDDKAELNATSTEFGLQRITGNDATVVTNAGATNAITINVQNKVDMKSYTNCFFFPIVPGEYDVVVFEYSDKDADVAAGDDDATNWKFIGYTNGDIDRTMKIGDFGGDDYNASNDLTIETALEINVDYMQNCEAVSKVMSDNTIAEAPVIINLNKNTASEHVKTINSDVESQYTIYIPQLQNNMVVNFKTTTQLPKKLVIKDVAGANNADYTVKFNFSGFDTNQSDIEISSSAKEVQLEGNYSFLTTSVVKVLAGNVTVTAADGNTSINVLTKTNGDGAPAGNLTVKGDATNTLAITTLNAGNATKLAISGAIAKTTIGTVNAEDASEIEVSGATTTDVFLKKAPTAFTVKGKGVITNINADASLNDALTSNINVNINTQDDAIISAFATNTAIPAKPGKMVYNLAAKFTSETTINNAVATASKEIYTAAQLNSIAGWGAPAKLMTAVEIESGNWTSPNLANNFDGNNKAITKLNAPLFGEIGTTVATITKLKISQANITAAAANCGVIAKVSKATNLAVTASTVAGTITSNKNYVGGMIGQVDAEDGDVSVTFGTNAAVVGAAATVTSNVTLVNNKTYTGGYDVLDTKAGTWGEYVGSVVNAGTNAAVVVINNDCAGAATAHTAKALQYDWKRNANFDAESRVQVIGYLKPTNCDNSVADRLWIGFVGTGTNQIPVVAPADITNITLTYPMTVNGTVKKVTFTAGGTNNSAVSGITYTGVLDGLGQNDKSGKKYATVPGGALNAATLYHNAYAEDAY